MEVKEQIRHWNKIAKSYSDNILGPFSEGISNPIFWYIDNKIENVNSKSVIDIGTGVGNFLPHLSEKFQKVVGIDISLKMIEKAKELTKDMKNIFLHVKDARDLSEFHNQFDVVIAVNSILMPNIIDINKMFKELHDVLKDDGILLGTFPTMDAVLLMGLLGMEKVIEEGGDHNLAIEKAKKIMSFEDCDFVLGTYNYDGLVQKHYYRFELKYRLKKAGFKNIKLRKIFYPWEDYGEERLLEIKNKNKPWDLFVFAKK